ncbi:GNAT family N-acetyltransferase [Muricauda sp. NFXS6]|uniref:GNAT family N-acetyltransferase n=1 Tax=Allomuricauda sp. NFXS6 TaxID=2819094 RepID=UPI0032DFA490
METHTKISSSPNELTQIKSWLRKEKHETGNGFYGNWDIIKEAWEDKRCLILLNKKSVVGFLVYRKIGPIANIMVFDIKPVLRKKGLGRKLMKDFTESLQTEGFWGKLDFDHLPNLYNVKSMRLDMYKIIVPKLACRESWETAETISLWDKEHYEALDCSPKWIWHLQLRGNGRELKKPIIHPINYKWLMEWKKGVLYCSKDLWGTFLNWKLNLATSWS